MAEIDTSCEQKEEQSPESFKVKANDLSHVKKVIAVVSGKGGVGKSLTTSILAVNAMRAGKKVAIMDADVTGPSIPTIFGLNELAGGDETHIYPVKSKGGVEVISLNLLVEDPAEPVVWRGPVVSGLIRQFWSDVAYGDIDELYIDMPPGTADVPLTVFQSLPIDAIVIVTSPQDLVSLIVEKALRMAAMMNVPVLGVVQNLAYLSCPDCGKKIYPFGEPNRNIAEKYGIPVADELPIDPKLAKACDEGEIEQYAGEYLAKMSEAIHAL